MGKPLRRLCSGTGESSGMLVPLSLAVKAKRGTRLERVASGQEIEAAV